MNYAIFLKLCEIAPSHNIRWPDCAHEELQQAACLTCLHLRLFIREFSSYFISEAKPVSSVADKINILSSGKNGK